MSRKPSPAAASGLPEKPTSTEWNKSDLCLPDRLERIKSVAQAIDLTTAGLEPYCGSPISALANIISEDIDAALAISHL